MGRRVPNPPAAGGAGPLVHRALDGPVAREPGRMRTVVSTWCFQCGAEYTDGSESCAECGVGLIDRPPLDPEEVGAEDEQQLAYDLHDWAWESRRMLDQLLTAHDVDHAWQGASLIIREADESVADELVEEVERATLPTLDPEKEQVAVELEGWTEEQVTELSERLGLLGVAHEFDADGDLVFHAEDEPVFDEVVADLEAGREEGGDDGLAEMDGLQLNALLSELFVATDRLRRDARDADAVLAFVEHAETLAGVRQPFGVDGATWRSLREQVAELDAMLRADDTDDADIVAHAGSLREQLHRMV